MDEEIEPAPLRLDALEHGVHRRRVGHVAMAGDMRVQLRGERLDALLQRVALVGERELRAGRAGRRGDPPGERAVVGDAHDEAALAAHHTFDRRFHPEPSSLLSAGDSRPQPVMTRGIATAASRLDAPARRSRKGGACPPKMPRPTATTSCSARLADIVGAENVLTGEADKAPYLHRTGAAIITGATPAVVKPGIGGGDLGDPEARQRDRHADRAAGRQYRAGRRADAGRERARGRAVARAARQDPRRRSRKAARSSPRRAWCWSACRRRRRRRACSFRSRSARRARAGSAATSPPMPAARRCSPTATRGASCSASKWCCRPARSGTGCAVW